MMRKTTVCLAMILNFGSIALGQSQLPTVTVLTDDTVLTESCRVVIPTGAMIADPNGNGVIQIVGDGITVEFAPGSELIGVPGLEDWETRGTGVYHLLTGTGIVVEGGTDVTIRGAVVRGYRVGIQAESTQGLTIEDAEITDIFQTPLRSTPAIEDSGDWLYPHDNDGGEWVAKYGAALSIKNAEGVTVRGVTVRRSQNGIVLDRVNRSKVYDNDCSYLSGWGIAMWRSSFNTVSRNALDYNVRGHSEGVYNRGQDSAGLLMFERCRSNLILENSATHCGDGIFAFAGTEAIGQRELVEGPIDYSDSGCNDNVFMGNDLSYSSAHGLELTFSENNIIVNNQFIGNAICGIWGGYSSGVRVHGNAFANNGGMPYGNEYGGINAEHASGWLIDENDFLNNRCGVHFWHDDDQDLLRLPGVMPGYRGVDGNAVVRNLFIMNSQHQFGEGTTLVGVWARRILPEAGRRTMAFGTNWLLENTFDAEPKIAQTIRYDHAGFKTPDTPAEDLVWFAELPAPVALGNTRPAGRSGAGRESIVMGPWRAWDFKEPLFREAGRIEGGRRYELFVPAGWGGEVTAESLAGPAPKITRAADATMLEPYLITVESEPDSVVSIAGFRVRAGEFERSVLVPLVRLGWSVRAWAWETDPLEDHEMWYAEAASVEPIEMSELDLAFGDGGLEETSSRFTVEQSDRFGIVAHAEVVLPAGRWRLNTLSDDGIRVGINGQTVIDRWDIHGPTPDSAEFESDGVTPTTIGIEYFENSGFAVLRVGIEPM